MDLYALAPEEFTAARDAEVKRVRAEGDRASATALAGLRRPTVSAHAVNALVRAEPELVDELLELGGQLAQAQAGGRGAELRELGEQRRHLVEAVTRRAVEAAGRDLPAAARGEVAATLEAALSDPASGDAVRTGRLVRALSYAGFGGVDLEGAVADAAAAPRSERADTSPGTSSRSTPEREAAAVRQRRLDTARAAALEAGGLLDDAVRAAEAAEQARERWQVAAEAAAERVTASEQALQDAREHRDEADAEVRRAGRDLERAHAAVEQAQRTADRSRAALGRLERT